MSRVKRLSRVEHGKVITTIYRKTWYGQWKLLVEYTMYEVRTEIGKWIPQPIDQWYSKGLGREIVITYRQVINIDNR